jgi:hypothetical protein
MHGLISIPTTAVLQVNVLHVVHATAATDGCCSSWLLVALSRVVWWTGQGGSWEEFDQICTGFNP